MKSRQEIVHAIGTEEKKGAVSDKPYISGDKSQALGEKEEAIK